MTDLTKQAIEALRGAANYIDTLGGCSKSYRQTIAAYEAAQQAGEQALPPLPYEQEKATIEGSRNAAADAYFKARAWMLDTAANRRLFEAGFDRGWASLRADEVNARTAQSSQPLPKLTALEGCFDKAAFAEAEQPLPVRDEREAFEAAGGEHAVENKPNDARIAWHWDLYKQAGIDGLSRFQVFLRGYKDGFKDASK